MCMHLLRTRLTIFRKERNRNKAPFISQNERFSRENNKITFRLTAEIEIVLQRSNNEP